MNVPGLWPELDVLRVYKTANPPTFYFALFWLSNSGDYLLGFDTRDDKSSDQLEAEELICHYLHFVKGLPLKQLRHRAAWLLHSLEDVTACMQHVARLLAERRGGANHDVAL